MIACRFCGSQSVVIIQEYRLSYLCECKKCNRIFSQKKEKKNENPPKT